MTEFESRLRAALHEFGVEAGEDSIERMVVHYELMLEWNERLNLTRILEPEAAARFHYAESAMCAQWLSAGSRLIDVGSGAGFPGLPIAALSPDRRVVLVESVRKKCAFLEAAVKAMKLSNVAVVNARYSPASIQPADTIVARAVDKFASLLPSLFDSRAAQILVFGGSELLDRADQLTRGKGARTPLPGSDRRWVGRFGRFT